MIQSEYGYVIQYPDKSVIIDTLRGLRKDCIRNFLSSSRLTWREWQRRGFKCVKVIIEVYKFTDR